MLKQSNEQPILFAVGINYKTAAVGLREKFYIQDEEIPALVAELKKIAAKYMKSGYGLYLEQLLNG